MRRFWLAVAVAAALQMPCPGQEDAEFVHWMKTTQESFNKLRGMTPKTGDEAAVAATKLQEVYGSLESYWTRRNAEDAIASSKEGKAAAGELAMAAKAGDADKAGAAFRTLAGTCRTCHEAHREKLPDGTYKIK